MLSAGSRTRRLSFGPEGISARLHMTFSKAIDRYELEISSQKRPNTRAREITSANRLRESFVGSSLKEITPALVAAFRDKRLQTSGNRPSLPAGYDF